MTMPLKNVIAAIIFALIGIVYGVLASDLPERAQINVPGPSFFPNLIAVFMVLLSVALAVKGIRGLKENGQPANGLMFPLKGIMLVTWIGVFIYAIPYVGFLFAGVPFFAGLMMLCNPGQKLHLLIAAVIVPALLFYLFRDGFQILLPHAPWL